MTTHHFRPTHYHRTIGPHEPVLRIAPGDTVVTTAVNAMGYDERGERVTEPGNPQTGPFFVEGAEEGDTLVVRFDRIAPTGAFGVTNSVVAPNVVDPDFARELPEGRLLRWRLDHERRVAALAEPLPGLGDFALPFAPMLGCFGVAPPRGQAISTATSAEHGGNMDYKGFAPGVTVSLPVFAPGALFHLGDAHAVQGAGEIVGTGIEVACEVEFSVELRKGKAIGWPRGEDAEWMFVAGNARPLDQALQHATTETLRWLRDEYGLDLTAASTLLGQCVEYEVGNVFDPAYTVICKVRKALLRDRAAG